MEATRKILLVDDDLGDTELTSEYLLDGDEVIELATLQDGIEALQFLRRQAPYHEAFRPDLIILDLNMPRKDGRELLAEIKHDPNLQMIPVIVFTTSDAPDDVVHVYQSGGNAYVTKPPSLADFAATIKAIKHFWLQVAQSPQEKGT